jgi:hypothetical protein
LGSCFITDNISFWLLILDDVHRRLFVQCHKFKLCDFCSVPFKQRLPIPIIVFKDKFVGLLDLKFRCFRFFDPSPLI